MEIKTIAITLMLNALMTISMINIASKKILDIVYSQLDKDTKEIFKFIEDKLS